MEIVISALAVLMLLSVVLFSGRIKRKHDRCEDLMEKSFQFLETFCCLREEQEVLGSAYLNFRRVNDNKVSFEAEMLLFFAESRVVLREDFGFYTPEEMTKLRGILCERVTATHPGIEISAGACRVCFR